MPDVGLDFEDLTRVRGGVAPQIFPVVGNTPAGLLLLLLLSLLLLLCKGDRYSVNSETLVACNEGFISGLS
jgi:hypothetical protein